MPVVPALVSLNGVAEVLTVEGIKCYREHLTPYVTPEKMWRRGIFPWQRCIGRVLAPHKFLAFHDPVSFTSEVRIMFDELFTSRQAIDRHSNSPLLEERLRYLAHCGAQGSTISSLRLIAQHLLVFIEQFDLEVEHNVGLEQIQKAANVWVGSRPQAHGMTNCWYGRMRFISDAKKWLAFLGRLRLPVVPARPYKRLIDAFCDALSRDRGLAQATIRIHRWHIEQFFDRYWQNNRPFSDICIRDIDAAISRKGEQDFYSRVSIANYVGVLRVFFRYAEQRGWCSRGLAAAIMCPRVFADEGLPKGPSWGEVQDLLAATEGDDPKHIRDRAIIMLFAVYGFRVGDVRALRLEDINWEKELICVTRPKSRRRHTYPLSYTVGEAILRYLKEVRPHTSHREIFLTLRAPIGPIGSGALYDLVSDRLVSLGVSLKHHGPHSLRHACASRLLAQGLSMKEIGDHLGHRKQDTTRVYAKVDLAGLRTVADFDIGGVL
jgi:integrase/recombinase XerD